MSVVINDLDLWKKEISLNDLLKNKEFLYRLSLKIDDIEEMLFWKIIENNDTWEVVWKDEFNSYFQKRLWK